MNAQTYDLIAESLRELHGRFGDALFTDRKRLTSLLFDKAPEAKREIRALATAVEEGVPAALSGAERHHLGLEIDRQASRLESGTGLRTDIALPIVRVIAYSLELGPLPSIYQANVPAAPQQSAPAAPAVQAWAQPSAPQAGPVHVAPQAGGAPSGAGFLDKLPFDKKYLAFGAAGVVALLIGMQMLNKPAVAPPPADRQVGDNTRAPPAVADDPNDQGYAGEKSDQGIAPKRELESNVGSPTPMSIPVGQRVTTRQVQQLIAAERSLVLVDVLADPHPNTLRGAVYIPAAGQGGSVTDNTQQRAEQQFAQATEGRRDRPMVFFCAGAGCWESYNAVLRASAAGYRNIYWYRGGLASWSAAGLPMQPLPGEAGRSTNFYQP